MNANSIKHCYIIYIDVPESIEYANECAKSCEQHGMPYTLWKGVENTTKESFEQETGLKCNANGTAMGCTASHLKLWRHLSKQPYACAVFEHDAIVKHNFLNYQIPDNKLVMLGYRVLEQADYDYPHDETTLIPIDKFEGTHAYAATPSMFSYMIDKIENEYSVTYGGIDTTIDGIISIQNRFGIDRCVMDPPPVICVVGNRISTIQGKPAEYNTNLSPGFLKGLKVPPLKTT